MKFKVENSHFEVGIHCTICISSKSCHVRFCCLVYVGLRDAYIICLNASESIDATRKGSEARFINHSW